MKHEAWFFFGVFLFIFIIWVAIGGPTRPIAFSVPALPQPSTSGGGTYLSLPRAPYGIGDSNVSLPGSSNGESVPSNTETLLPSFIGSGFGSVSPYRTVVSMNHYVSGAGAENPEDEYVEITVSGSAGVPVDLSGWTLESDATGAASIIPKGTEVPTSGIVNAAQDIVLTPGERALVISGQSPIGASFRENKCIGYFSTFQHFSPPLPQNCPVPSDELASRYGTGYIRDAACIDYVDTLSRCQVALSPPVGASSACQSFLVKYLNYNGCVDAHGGDADFKGDTWRIYLGRTNSMWRTRHEVVKLLDAQGKTVDAFGY
ncbi:hypothetical protein KGQ25_02480 [Patescibacteria group bacterium]|nr:hypothetical protein [Patescibacteria group bacterium]MDE2173282.1 hypothetical protein [Patescibacteria group bacterium]